MRLFPEVAVLEKEPSFWFLEFINDEYDSRHDFLELEIGLRKYRQ